MKHIFKITIFLLFLFFLSCDNVSTEAKTGSVLKTNVSPKLKALSYKMKSGSFFQPNVDSTDVGFDFDMSKSLNIFVNSANYIDLYDKTKTFSYKVAFADFMYQDSSKFLEFENVKLGNLELKNHNSYWIDPADSNSYGGSGITTVCDSDTVHIDKVHIYSWFQTGEFPNELNSGSTPTFRAEYNASTISKTLSPMPNIENVFKSISTSSVIDLNEDFVIEFNSDLPVGTFVGMQVLPLFESPTDSTFFIQGGEIYNLYLETELTVKTNSVTFTKDMLREIRENIDDATKVIADVFVLTYSKHGEFNIDANKKAEIVIGSSSAVSVHLKK